jgi:hypothetical protein
VSGSPITLSDKRGLANRVVVRGDASDFVHAKGKSSAITNCSFFDTSASTEAHKDFIQIIPTCDRAANMQYAGEYMDTFIAMNNHFYSEGFYQPIFNSDGGIGNVAIRYNVMHTRSAHGITLSGVRGGLISDNYLADGETPAHIRLLPLRLAGGFKGGIYVMSFTNDAYNYATVKGLTEEDRDLRFTHRSRHSRHLYNFDLDKFNDYCYKLKYHPAYSTRWFIKRVYNAAFKFGEEK